MSEAVATLSDLDLLHEAIYGERGDEQKHIAEHGLAWVSLMLRKNHDYGGAVWQPPVLLPMLEAGDAIRVRMGDKIERLKSLWGGRISEVSDESIDDTIRDLGAYCLLYLARPK
ncbi:MAG: DUF1599 domain-containing protein [Bradyrhizobium sp.]|nr:DUF1599 domain-containing protein [Bradyrhizobium sp.]